MAVTGPGCEGPLSPRERPLFCHDRTRPSSFDKLAQILKTEKMPTTIGSAMPYTPQSVTPEIMQDTYSVPTIVVNRFVISTSPNSFRVVFGESYGEKVHYRVGVSMTPLEAYDLKNLLESLLIPFAQDIENVISTFEKAAADEKPE